MEKSADKLMNDINLRNREIKILIPGYFNMIHAGHMQLIQDAKSSFKKVNLTIGIIEDESAVPLLALHEKVETFKNFPEVDKVCVLKQKPGFEDLKMLNIDYIATANPKEYPNSSKILRFDKKVVLNSDEIFARVIRNYDYHIENLLDAGFQSSSLSVSRPHQVTVLCKRKVRQLKQSLWNTGFNLTALEDSVNSARRYLQETFSDWGDTQEKILRKWLGRCKTSTSFLFQALRGKF